MGARRRTVNKMLKEGNFSTEDEEGSNHSKHYGLEKAITAQQQQRSPLFLLFSVGLFLSLGVIVIISRFWVEKSA